MASEELTNQVDGTTIEATEIIPAAPSKKSLKKAAKAEKYAAMKLERRAREKEAKKEKKRARAEQIANGEINEDDEEEKKRQKKKPRLHFGGKVVVDLGFDDKMSEKVKLTSKVFVASIHLRTGDPILMFSTCLHL